MSDKTSKLSRKLPFNITHELILLVVLIALIAFFALMSENFLTASNFINVIRQSAMLGIIAAGMTMVLLIGGIDLSVASNVALTSVVAALAMAVGITPILAVLIGLAIGTTVGMINGLIVTKIGIPALITTLGMMTIVRGIAFVSTDGYPVFDFPDTMRWIGTGHVFQIPVPAIIMAIVFLVVWFVLYRTKLGRHIYALGGNQEAARLSGINIFRVKMFVYMTAGLCSGIAGLILLGRLDSGQPNALQAFELEVVTAVVLGGVSIFGGQGKLIGVFLGVLILGVLANGLVILNVGEFYQMVITGLVLLIAVGIDRVYNRKKD